MSNEGNLIDSMKMKKKPRLAMEECSVILPQEMLIEIFLRLSVKSLARFKCVSKSWLSLISDPSFAQSHYDLALARTDTVLLQTDGCHQIASIDFNAPSLQDYTTELLNPPIPQLPQFSDDDYENVPEIIGSCRGFMLVSCGSVLYIWNSCTGIQRRIPSPPSYVDPGRVFLQGFGYDSSTDDYLVTLGCYYYQRGYYLWGQRKEIRVVVIFSVRANTWKQFDGIIPKALNHHNIDPYPGGLFFNGANHWIARRRRKFRGKWVVDVIVIVVFDLTERVFFEIALPDLEPLNMCELHVVIGGFLSVCPVSWNGCDDKLLVMEEYNRVQSSWKCLCFSNLRHFPHRLLPLCVTVGGDIVGIDHEFRKLVKFNVKGEGLERRDYDDYPDRHPRSSVVVMHTHTLLSLPCHN